MPCIIDSINTSHIHDQGGRWLASIDRPIPIVLCTNKQVEGGMASHPIHPPGCMASIAGVSAGHGIAITGNTKLAHARYSL